MIPKIIAKGWSQSSVAPPNTPIYKPPVSDPPPSVSALCSHPGPDSLRYPSRRDGKGLLASSNRRASSLASAITPAGTSTDDSFM